LVNAHGRFVWYELITTDVKAAMAFYTKVMGWGAWDASTPGRGYILFTIGNAAVSGLMRLQEDASKKGTAPHWLGYLGVDDLDAAVDRIKSLGGAVQVPPTDVADISRFAVFTDPQTARFGLFKWLTPGQEQPPELHAPGRVGWHELLAADWEKAWAFYAGLFGWQEANAVDGPAGRYQQFSAGGQTIGAIFNKPPTAPVSFWLYSFNVDDIDAAAQRVKAGGGQISDGPLEGPIGTWTVQCTDPQGAVFALEGKRNTSPVGYFERVGSRNPADTRSRRWSW